MAQDTGDNAAARPRQGDDDGPDTVRVTDEQRRPSSPRPVGLDGDRAAEPRDAARGEERSEAAGEAPDPADDAEASSGGSAVEPEDAGSAEGAKGDPGDDGSFEDSGSPGTAPRARYQAPPTTEPGRTLAGRYRLVEIVGRGGMGTVWRARDEVLNRSVAVKELRLPSGVEDIERRRLITRTLREAKAIASIRNTGVVTIYDVVDESDRPWIVMELIEGLSLADVIRDEGPMPAARVAVIGLAILDVLRVVHAAGIIHRDVKPSNVLVAQEDGRVILTDFGIAKVEGDPSVTSTGMLVGAPSYISPERARGEVLGPPADMWSLGALLYCCVEGRPPYDAGSAIATLAAVMHDPVQPPEKAGPLTEVITGLLTRAPGERLDEPRARAMLQAVLDAQPGADRGDRTLVVPAAPPAPAAERPAVPVAAPATPPPAPASTPPPSTPPPSAATPDAHTPTLPAVRTPDGRRRTLIVATVVLVVLALLGTVMATVLNGGDGDGQGERSQGGDGGSGEGGNGGSGGDGSDGGNGGSGGDSGNNEAGPPEGSGEATEDPAPEDPAPEPTGESSGEGEDSAPPATEPGDDPDASLPGSPPGFSEYFDEDFNFAISLPNGWQRTRIAGQNSGGVYSAPDGGPPRVQVDFTGSPGQDAEASWRSQEPSVASNSTDYERISLETVGWRGYPTVADWEFERTENGERVRVLNRGFVVDDTHGYAIMITCAEDEWDGAECTALRETAFETFQPWDGTN